jgi:hypothetical protein
VVESPSEHKYDTFLSSCFWDVDPRDPSLDTDLKAIRQETSRHFSQEGVVAWTWEDWEKCAEARELEAKFPPGQVPTFTQIAVFRRALIQSRTIIIFVSKRRGSQVSPWTDGLVTYGTFFEIEVFFAIALNKPIILFREEGASVEEPLQHLLDAAARSKAIYHEEIIRRSELPTKSLAAYRSVEGKLKASSGWFTTLLAQRRDPVLDYRRTMGFLYGVTLPPLSGHPDLDVIDRLVSAAQEPNLVLSERLSRLWLAIQEMLPHRQKLLGEPPLLERWLDCLDQWGGAASWFGLHAHLGVSPLVTQADRARAITASNPLKASIPYGPMASARYSIARREALGMRRMREMRKVIAESKLAIGAGDWDDAGAYAIMGHAFIYSGRLLAAVDAFERSLSLREQERNAARIGEGKCDLGFGLFLTGRVPLGVRMMEEGIQLLESSGDSGFYLKSSKKLELAYKLMFRRDEAVAQRKRRMDRAVAEEFFDQAN